MPSIRSCSVSLVFGGFTKDCQPPIRSHLLVQDMSQNRIRAPTLQFPVKPPPKRVASTKTQGPTASEPLGRIDQEANARVLASTEKALLQQILEEFNRQDQEKSLSICRCCLFVCLLACLFVCLFVLFGLFCLFDCFFCLLCLLCLFVCLFLLFVVFVLFVCLFCLVCVVVCFVCLFCLVCLVCLFVCLFVCLILCFFCLFCFFWLFVCFVWFGLFVCLLVCLFACLFVCLWLGRPVNARVFWFFPPCNGRKNAQIIWFFTGFVHVRPLPRKTRELYGNSHS